MFNQLQFVKIIIWVFEVYDGGVCYFDIVLIIINNGIVNFIQFDIFMMEGSFVYWFWVDVFNIVLFFFKIFQVIVEVNDEQDIKVQSVVVLGWWLWEIIFIFIVFELLIIILRDLLGDGSYFFLEIGEIIC